MPPLFCRLCTLFGRPGLLRDIVITCPYLEHIESRWSRSEDIDWWNSVRTGKVIQLDQKAEATDGVTYLCTLHGPYRTPAQIRDRPTADITFEFQGLSPGSWLPHPYILCASCIMIWPCPPLVKVCSDSQLSIARCRRPGSSPNYSQICHFGPQSRLISHSHSRHPRHFRLSTFSQ